MDDPRAQRLFGDNLVAPGDLASSPFRVDRDRIVSSPFLARLAGVTQVISPGGAGLLVHNRLTHSLKVAQVGRAIAERLASGSAADHLEKLGGCDPDVVEAAALAHDLGHPPFGHGGEHALDAALADAGGFDHNAHTVRIVTLLETPYPDFDGLNLSWEALEGLAKHNGPVDAASWAMAEANARWDLELATWPSLEAQVAAISDDIAYDNHDIDDGLRAGLLDLDELLELGIVQRLWRGIEERHPGISLEKRQRALTRDMIGTMVEDVLAETGRRVREAGVETIDDVRRAGRQLAGFSEALAKEEKALKSFLYDRLYGSPELEAVRREAERVVTNLASVYRDDASRLPDAWQRVGDRVQQLRTIGDFIAGMTDRFAIARHEELVGPVELPDRF